MVTKIPLESLTMSLSDKYDPTKAYSNIGGQHVSPYVLLVHVKPNKVRILIIGFKINL